MIHRKAGREGPGETMKPIREEPDRALFLTAPGEPEKREPQDAQEVQDHEPAPGTYYYFDCLDGTIGSELLTPQEISKRLYGEDRQLTEADIKRIAADYEAELHRYILTGGAGARHEQLTRLQW